MDEEVMAPAAEGGEAAPSQEGEEALVKRLRSRIEADAKHYKARFEQMERDMKVARTGQTPGTPDSFYKANITGRHINNTVAALYAKNPKPVARRRPRLDFQIWDENLTSLQTALASVQALMGTGIQIDPMTGQPVTLDPVAQQSLDLLRDFEAGMQERRMFTATGKTLEVLFQYYLREQRPVDFKTAMKKVVRRAKVCGVAYVEIGFQREMEANATVQNQIADYRQQLQHLQMLGQKVDQAATGESAVTGREAEADAAELRAAISSLEKQQYVLIREGLTFDYPQANRVIPSCYCASVTGFLGADWLTVEYYYTADQIMKLFGVDMKKSKAARYRYDGKKMEGHDEDGQYSLDLNDGQAKDANFVRVWKHYDRNTGSVYYIADGHPTFLRPPAPPDVYVEDFWPVYALTFNEVEDPSMAIPPSDVELMMDPQAEYNRSRQGLREHRKAARPRYATPKGALDDESKVRFRDAEAHDVVEFNPQGADPDVRKIIQQVPVSGVDPNLYQTGEIFTDVQLILGAQEAQFGAVSNATASEAAIADASRAASISSNVDDLDNFLSAVARGAGQVLLREVSPETAAKIAGRGAVWPTMNLEAIADEVYLEIEAGSSGRPNQAAEIANWERMLPFLIQMPAVTPEWLARETLRRLDDRMDLTDAITQSMPAIVALNRMAHPSPADPGAAPDQQGGEGADNGPGGPPQADGSSAPMGNNQV